MASTYGQNGDSFEAIRREIASASSGFERYLASKGIVRKPTTEEANNGAWLIVRIPKE